MSQEKALIQAWVPTWLADALDTAAERQMTSKASLIRQAVLRELGLFDYATNRNGETSVSEPHPTYETEPA